MPTPIEVRGEVDPRAVKQLARCAEAGHALRGVLCADGHVGYSQPIGGALAYPDHISPSGVGYDIACGNKAARTNLLVEDVLPDLRRIMDAVFSRISFGVGRGNDEPVDHPVLDAIRQAEFAPQRKLAKLAADQLGTVGAGNHYVDLFAGDDGHVWVGVHFGSRGFGHRTATGFLALAAGQPFEGRPAGGEMDSPPVLLHVDSELGRSYVAAMELAGRYAYAGRDTVVAKVLELLGAESTYEVHNHHNFAWRERHFDTDVWVVRKGCTPAFPGQLGFVGATMGEPSVILEGVEGDGARDLLYSTVHGAGRVMSRTEAAGRSRKRWSCPHCGWTQERKTPVGGRRQCPSCGRGGLVRRWVKERPGKVDWAATTAALRAAGIQLRGGAADEAPDAYKRLDTVLAAHTDAVRVLHELRPIGVAMAGGDMFDPYKD
jgi:tRNA-splicing ligase RtcB